MTAPEKPDVRCSYQPPGQPQCGAPADDARLIPLGKGHVVALLCTAHCRRADMALWSDRERVRRDLAEQLVALGWTPPSKAF